MAIISYDKVQEYLTSLVPPREHELQAMEEDVKMRAALLGKTLRQEHPGNLPGTVPSPTGTQRGP